MCHSALFHFRIYIRQKSFPGKELLFMMMLAMMMIPGVLTLIPSYVLYNNLGLTNTPWVIIIAGAAGGQIFGTFLCRSFMSGIPSELFEAARIDGASEIRVFFKSSSRCRCRSWPPCSLCRLLACTMITFGRCLRSGTAVFRWLLLALPSLRNSSASPIWERSFRHTPFPRFR